MSTTNDTLQISRLIKAPRERVFAAFSTGDAVKKWFGPPDGEILESTMDFRVGGKYRIKINSPRMGVMAVSGTYREIIELEKIVYTWKWEDDEDWENIESLVCFDFTVSGDETELKITHTGFPVAESRENHTHGWTVCLERLDALLAS
jgi:glutathione S-transferase